MPAVDTPPKTVHKSRSGRQVVDSHRSPTSKLRLAAPGRGRGSWLDIPYGVSFVRFAPAHAFHPALAAAIRLAAVGRLLVLY
jgi:hypothetical protein